MAASGIPQLPLREYGIGGEPKEPLIISVRPLPNRGTRDTSSPWRRGASVPTARPRVYVLHGPLPSGIGAIIREKLPGWQPTSKLDSGVDFYLCISGGGRGWFDLVRSRLKCRLDAPILTDKFRLHMALEGTNVIQPTYCVTRKTILPADTVWMIRANWGVGGSGCGAVDTTESMIATVESWDAAARNRRRVRTRVIASEYVKSPLLHDGYKFHVRAHMVVSIIGNTKRYYQVAETMDVVRATAKWEYGNWDDFDVHVTTFADCNINERSDGAALREGVTSVISTVMDALLSQVSLYPESPNAYEVYAVDVMFHDDYHAIILDINSTPRMNGRVEFVGRELVDIILAGPFKDVFGQ